MNTMETESVKERDRSVLLPERHSNHDLFICDVLDAIPKDDLASMEHPLFTLATKPDTRVLTYEHRNVKVCVTPSVKGLATIFDKDLLIYCISQMIAKKNQGKVLSQTVQLHAHDLLVWTNRETSGDAYRRLLEAFERLAGTRVTTNIKANGEETTEGFGLIDKYKVVRQTGNGRMSEIEVRLSDWMYKIIQGSEVLTLSRDYFRLRKPIERRIYEIARKHCGEQDEWRISLALLQKKVGSTGGDRKFRMIVKELAQHNHLPEYTVRYDDEIVIFSNRSQVLEKEDEDITYPTLAAETYHDARIVAPGYDVYHLEMEWREMWVTTGQPPLHDADKAFIGFCKSRAKRKPMQRGSVEFE
jgi:plasmid replication initiation protein